MRETKSVESEQVFRWYKEYTKEHNNKVKQRKKGDKQEGLAITEIEPLEDCRMEELLVRFYYMVSNALEHIGDEVEEIKADMKNLLKRWETNT